MKKVMSAIILTATVSTNAWLLTAFAQEHSPGVTKTEIKIGHTNALSGPLSLVGGPQVTILQKYFEVLNGSGGVNGRKIIFDVADDAYNPAKTVEQTRRLVENDEVLLLFSPFGTPTSAATAPYLNKAKVPQLFVGSGSSMFNNSSKYPWTTAQLPNYRIEGEVYGKFLATQPDAMKIGVLYQNDDFGKDLLAGLKNGLGDRANTVIAELSYESIEPTVDSQIAALKSSGATVFVNFAAGRACIQAITKAYDSGWKPLQIMASPFAGIVDAFRQTGLEKASGIITGQYLKDPADPAWAHDAGMNEYRNFMRKELPKINAESRAPLGVYTVAKIFVRLLEGLGDNITRDSVMNAATHIDGMEIDTLLPGTKVETTPDMRNLFRLRTLARFDGKTWVTIQELK